MHAQVEVQDASAALDVLRRSTRQRKKATTSLNAQSSRSHSVFCIVTHWRADRNSTGTGGDGGSMLADNLFLGRLSFVDLAGGPRHGIICVHFWSCRQADTRVHIFA